MPCCKAPIACLLSTITTIRRGGADVLFLEHNRMMERIGWQVVPFAMRHPKNLDTPWSDYFPDEIEFGSSYSLGDKLIRAPRVIYSMQTRRNMSRLLNAINPSIAHIHNIYHHLSPSFLPLLKQRGIPVVMTVHDLKLACPAYTMMLGGKPCERCRGGKLYNVAVNRCIKGSLALSSLVMVESYLHRLLRAYEGNIDRFIVPSRFMLEKLVQWGWARERFVHIPNFVDIDRFKPGSDAGQRFVYCGRLDELKGVETLVRAACLARQPLTLVGSGPLEARLRALGEELGGDLIFTGHLTKDSLVAVIQSAGPSSCHQSVMRMRRWRCSKPMRRGAPSLVRASPAFQNSCARRKLACSIRRATSKHWRMRWCGLQSCPTPVSWPWVQRRALGWNVISMRRFISSASLSSTARSRLGSDKE